MASRNIVTKEGLKFYDKTGIEEDEDEEKMDDETVMYVVPPNNIATFDESEMFMEPPNNITTTNEMIQDITPTTELTSNINQELEYAPEDYIFQAIEDSTTVEPQPDNGEIPNVEDHTSDIAHDINNTNNENDVEA